jgi:hypothetical protein
MVPDPSRGFTWPNEAEGCIGPFDPFLYIVAVGLGLIVVGLLSLRLRVREVVP